MIGKHHRLGGALALALILLIQAPHPALSNGWEHGAVPFETLIEALSFDRPAIREQAAHSLGLRGQAEAVQPLLDRLALPEPDGTVRQSIYVALGRLGAPEALPALSRCLTKESAAPARARCVEALGGLGSREALGIILATLARATDALVRDHAVDALGAFPHRRVVATLTDLLQASDDTTLRQRIHSPGARPDGVGGRGGAVAERVRDREQRRRALRGAARSRRHRRAGGNRCPVRRPRTSREEPRMRAAIAVALGASRDGDAADALLALLGDPVPAVRYSAVSGLQSLGIRRAALPLAALAGREAATLAGRSATALTADRQRTVAALSLQARALRAAVALDAPMAAQALLDAAAPIAIPRSSTAALEIAAALYQRRRIALHGLGYATGAQREAAVALLLGPGGIGDADARLRAVAVRSLGVLGDPDAAHRIGPLLGADPSADVRMTAARVLGLLHDRESAAALLAALADPHALVRREAALALGYLREPAARARLEALALGDRADAVRDAAAYALTLLPGGR